MFCETCERNENCFTYIQACKTFCLSGGVDRTELDDLDNNCMLYKEKAPDFRRPIFKRAPRKETQPNGLYLFAI